MRCCGVSLIFPLLAVALVMRLVVLMACRFGAGGRGPLLAVVGVLVMRARWPGLASLVVSLWSAGGVALCSVVAHTPRLLPGAAGGTAARLLLGCLTWGPVRVLHGGKRSSS